MPPQEDEGQEDDGRRGQKSSPKVGARHGDPPLPARVTPDGRHGAPFHVGGKFWAAQSDPDWQAMAAWVRTGEAPADLAAAETTPPPLDFGFFRSCVQQIFLNKREGRMECKHCHSSGSRGFARTIADGRSYWNLEESRQNFELIKRYVEPGYPLYSRFLTHPLAPEAGGDHYHSGGRRWFSQNDPEWQMLAAWVRGEEPRCLSY